MALDILDILGDKAGTSTKSIVGTLFGTSPDVLASQIGQQNLANTQQTAMAYAQMDPMQRAQYAMFQGAAGGTGGLLQAVGAENPQIARAKQSAALQQQISQLPLDTVEGQKQAMDIALQAGRPEIAIQLRDVFLKQGKTQADIEKARREDTDKITDRNIYQSFVKKFGGDETKASFAFDQYKQDQSERRAKAGAVQIPGQVKVPDIGTFRNDVRSTLKPLDDQYRSAQFALQQVDAIRKGNMKAVPQLDRAIATLVGDKQLGQAEVAMLANAGSFPDRVVAGYQKFVTGGPTAMSLAEKEAIIEAAQNQVALNYNRERENLINVWGTSNMPMQTVEKGVGDPKVSSLMQKQQQKQTQRANMGMVQQPTTQIPKFTVGQKFTKADGTVVTRQADGTWR